MDKVSTMETNPVLLARVLFNAFSKLRRPAARLFANLDKTVLSAVPTGLNLERVVLTQIAKAAVFSIIYGRTKQLAEKLMFRKGTAYLAAASIRPYVNALQ
jgi:hypothetical protein